MKTLLMRVTRLWWLSVLLMVLGSVAAEAAPFAYVTVLPFGPDFVSVIDTASNTVVATVTVGSVPVAVAITPNAAFAYVANSDSNTVAVIDTATNTVVATIPVGTKPTGVAITPNGSFAYVVNTVSGTVSVIDTARNTVDATIPVGGLPNGVAITPDGAFAYVTNDYAAVAVISTATYALVATIPVGGVPLGVVAVTPDGTRAYVTDRVISAVWVIDTASRTVVAAVELGPLKTSERIAITPNGAYVYVTIDGEFCDETGCFQDPETVGVIATATNTIVATVPVAGSGVAITPF